MRFECATCKPSACRVGRIDVAPENCPMRGPLPPFEDLYRAEAVRQLAYHSTRVEAEGYCRWTRVHEIVELARRMAYRRIGVAHCQDMVREAALAGRYFHERGLEAVLPDVAGQCEPVRQAELFAERGTDFNVIAGMCVGHDALFIRHSRAPVTSLVVRDRRLRHHPAGALYASHGYLSRALFGHPKTPLPTQPPPWDDERLDRIAREVRDAGLRRSDPPCRIEEIVDFAQRAGVRRLGLVFCNGFREEASRLNAVLSANGFSVSSICCKVGSVPKEELGLLDSEKIRPGEPEMICNALTQAELLEQAEVELALLLGQCVGHDSATISHLHVPAVCVVAKDRVLVHNTAAALYELEHARTV
jgi:uncharacterized metal-binding protein